MTSTLRSPEFVKLAEGLFVDSEVSKHALMDQLNRLPPSERAAMRARDGYRELYARAKDTHLAVSPATARLLYILARSAAARTVVEFGTSFGISTLFLAAAVRDNGGGRVIGSEFEPTKGKRARANLAAAGLPDTTRLGIS